MAASPNFTGIHLNPITGYWALSVHENTHKPGVKEQITEMAFNGA
ncbi:TPA: IS1-like element transposase, partial [Escherichia coli]